MGEYEDLCNESAEELEAAHARIEMLTKRVAELEATLDRLIRSACFYVPNHEIQAAEETLTGGK